MIECIVVDYETALILAKAQNEICVQCTHGGDFGNFFDDQWSHSGVLKPREHLIENYDMDSEFNFVWFKNVITK